MSFNISYVSNDINIKLAKDTIYAIRTESFAPNDTYTLIDTDQSVIIDTLEWIPRNETDATIAINVKGMGNGAFINHIGTGEIVDITPFDIINGVNPFFEVVKYDISETPSPIIRFRLKNPLNCPKGIRVILKNKNTELTFRNSCQIRGRVM